MNNTNVLPHRGRLPALDVVRGIAIVGTLATNIWVFSHPWGLLGMLSAPVLTDASSAEATSQLALMALAQGKFLALLSLTFGVGLAIQHRSSVRRHQRWPGRYLWRAALLLVDGVVNYILIAEFDVLMGYAVTAAVVSFLLLTRPRAQRVLILVFGGIHLAVISLLVVVLTTLPGADADLALPADASPYADASFWGLAAFRLDNVAIFRAEPVLIGFLSLAMFLAGAALLREGVFSPEGARLRRRLMIAGLCAVPVDIFFALSATSAGLLLERYVVAPVVALGILGLVVELCLRRGTDGWLGRRATEVGRVALSAYLMQNLLGGALFYGWGLGLAETLAPWRVPVTVGAFLVITVVVATAAHLWLRRFSAGPIEWLWRAAADLGARPRSAAPPRPGGPTPRHG